MGLPYTAPAPALAAAHPSSEAPLDMRLIGRRLVAARAAWIIITILTLAVFIAGVVAALIHVGAVCPTPACDQAHLDPVVRRAIAGVGYSYADFIIFSVVLSLLLAIPYAGVALLIYSRRSDDGMALLTSLALLTFGLLTFTPMSGALAAAVPATQLPVLFLSFLGSVGFFGFLYVFPTGRVVPRWVLWIALVWTIQQVLHIFFAGSPADTSTWPLPIQLAIWSVFLGSVVYAQVFRYRHVSTPAQRLQTKWVVYGVTVAFLIYLITEAILIAIIRDLSQLTPGGLRASLAGSVVIYLGMLLIPLSIAIGTLRYRLFDVDILISRTLLYGALTLCVLGLYILIVGGFTLAFQEPGNPAIRLLATGVVAVAFQPLRERLQRGVNRLVYGRRDEPYAVLSQLARRLEATLAPAAVLPTVVETVAQALKLPYAAIALGQDGAFVTAASYGALAGEPLILPLVHQSETVGRLVLAPRGPGEGWTAADRRLLDDLAYQAGIAAHAVRLTDELQRARERLVLAREEERRRLRRDLHDGLGPQLASQTLTLTAAAKLLRQDPAAADALLTEATTHAQQAIADIRRVVYDLRPPALDDLGLIAALREQVARYHSSGIQFVIAAPDLLPPLPAAVEVACYRIAQEALTNVVRHAGARQCALALTIDDKLRLEVRDDGTGIPPDRHAGVGLTSMRERAEELGGACVVAAAPEGGTRVFARLPLA